MKESKKILLYLKYLENGLIPVESFSGDGIEDFKKKLNSLSYEEKRKINRKFRKIFKKIAKNRDLSNQTLISLYGAYVKKPNKMQIRARRRLVHEEFRKIIESEK
jgi:hypothetical protein